METDYLLGEWFLNPVYSYPDISEKGDFFLRFASRPPKTQAFENALQTVDVLKRRFIVTGESGGFQIR